ncbi:MAG TPA: aminotransferase class IV [Pyrinomonadaceae bacterium]|jgi:branched-subunit amino acid aminotransferase/4-amino-4-deoxychorismate lyase
MHAHIIHNNRLIEAEKSRMPSVTSATLYGRGVFTTLAVYQGRPFLWPQHWARLATHAVRAGVRLDHFDEETVSASLLSLIEANKVETGRARVTLLAHAVGGYWKSKAFNTRVSDLLIITGDPRRISEQGLTLTISPYRSNTLSPLAGLKSVNYLEHIMSWEEARARDFDEAVVLNERGEVVSATMANIFWVKQGTAHTPALSTGALAGTTRARIIELAGDMAVPLVEGVYDVPDLADADEIFLTSSALGVAIVTTFDFRRYTVSVGSVALRLREAFRQLTLHID